MPYKTSSALLLLCGVWSSASIAAPITHTVTFEDALHGEIISNQYFSSYGLTISATNPNKLHDLAIIFDTNATGTADNDLEFGGGWSTGNIENTAVGNILIIAENNTDTSPADGYIDSPDDQGDNASADPSGTLIFDFGSTIDLFGFDLIDVENNFEMGNSAVVFYDGSDTELYSLSFADFLTRDASIEYANNSANRIFPIDLSDYSTTSKVVFEAGGSLGIDNITWQTNVVPEPGTIALMMFGLAGLGFSARRNRQS